MIARETLLWLDLFGETIISYSCEITIIILLVDFCLDVTLGEQTIYVTLCRGSLYLMASVVSISYLNVKKIGIIIVVGC
jgi:hypothetical protein